MKQSDYDFMVAFAIDHASVLPVQHRIRVYRGAAVALGDNHQAPTLKALAADLEAADERCREFAFQFAVSSVSSAFRPAPVQGGAR